MNLARFLVGDPAQVFVLGQVERALSVLWLQVEVVHQDGLHAFPVDGAVLERAGVVSACSNRPPSCGGP